MSVGMQRLRDDAEAVRRGASDKGYDAALVDAALRLDETRRKLLGETDTWRSERKALSAEVAAAMKAGGDADAVKAKSVELGSRIDSGEEQLRTVEAELDDLLLRIPNPADGDVPVGAPELTQTVREWGEPIAHDAGGRERQPHWEIGERLGILDLAAGAKVSGTGFPIYRGAGARLERALINMMLELQSTANGMTEMATRRRQPGFRARHRPDPGQRGADVRRDARRPLSRSDRRSLSHEHSSRRDH